MFTFEALLEIRETNQPTVRSLTPRVTVADSDQKKNKSPDVAKSQMIDYFCTPKMKKGPRSGRDRRNRKSGCKTTNDYPT